MIRLEVTVTGHDKAAAILGAVLRPMREMRPLWQAIRPVLEQAAVARFGSQGSSDGAPWAPLSPAYARRKAMTHPGRGILQRDGSLRDSLLMMNGPGHVYRETATDMVWGTVDPKAAHHQYGTSRMPAREVIRVTPADERAIEVAVERVFADAARGAGH